MNSGTQILLSGIRDITDQPLEDAAKDAARLRLLDYLGCTLAGAEMERSRMERLVASGGESTGPARLIGMGLTTAPFMAALVNGANAHVAELDDGNRFGMVHPGAPIISAILAQAQASGFSDDDILLGIVAGYEAAIRLARTIQPYAKERGLHATGASGTVGAAVGVAAALRLDEDGMTAALSGGATAASGLLKVIRGASQLKPFNSGQAAQAGLSAALMAQAGFLGPSDVLDGEQGYLQIMTGKPDVALEPLAGTGRLCVGDVYVKPYASCRHCHAPVEAAIALREAHALTASDIDKVTIKTHRIAVYQHDHTEIPSVHSAKMSINYCTAAALVTGHSGMPAFSPENVADPGILDLTRRIDVIADPELTALVPAKRAAVVDVHRHDGSVVSSRIDLPKGEPETALTPTEFQAKFLDLARFSGMAPDAASALAASILAPEHDNRLLHTINAL